MFFGYTEEEKMLQRSVRDMFKEKNTSEDIRAFMDNPQVSDTIQKLIAQQGLLGILDFEGSEEDGNGMIHGTLMAQEAGRYLLTYPLTEAMIGLAALKTCKQHGDLIKDVENGKKLLTVAWKTVDATARKADGAFLLNGTLKEVPFAADADVIIANVRVKGTGFTPAEEQTVVVLDAKHDALQVDNSNSMDETYPLYEVSLSNYPLRTKDIVKGLGMGAGNKLFGQMRETGALLAAAELVGSSERTLYETVEYSKQRKQFGVLIGTFQAMKHMAADMYVKVESAKSAVEYAAWAIDTDNEEAEIAVSIAKSYASSAGVEVTGDAIQMHGGIGYTWENDMHLFFKRARRTAALLGDTYTHREKIAKVAIDELIAPKPEPKPSTKKLELQK